MRIVFLAGDAEFDYRLDVDPDRNPTVADLVAALAGPDVDPTVGLSIDGRFAPPVTPLAVAALREGSTCTLAAGPVDEGSTGPALAVTAGLGAGETFVVGPAPASLGRGPDNGIVLESATVSRHHARLQPGDRGVVVEDLGARNGTEIDGAWVTSPSHLPPRSTLRVGAVELELAPPTDDRPLAAAGTGPRIAFNRPPRPALPAEPAPLRVPVPPADGGGGAPFSWAAVLAPLAIGGVLAMLFGPLMAAFALLSPVMLVASWWEQRRRHARGRRRASRRYAADLSRFGEELEEAHRTARARLRALLPDAAEVVRRATAPSTRLWERRPDAEDFLLLRAGTADVPWRPKLSVAGDDVDDDVAALLAGRTCLERCPVPLLLRGITVGIVGDRGAALALARSLVCQAAVHHGPADLTIAAVAHPDRAGDWAWLQWLPHHGADGDALAATTEDELDGLLEAVRASSASALFVVDGDQLSSPRAGGLRAALTGGAGIVIAASADRLPAVCRSVVTLTDAHGGAVVTEPATGAAIGDVLLAGMAERTARRCARALARFDDPEVSVPGAGLPGRVALVDLLGAGAPEPAAILRRWSAGGTAAPVGVWTGGPLEVDLVADGPHALIGGTTGSGKSELLRTLVVSLAATAPPDRLTFVLVDYKGGSAFDECARLPHVVGMVTDLDEHLGARALRCLEAELHHRERVLRAAGAGDLRAYEAAGRPGGPLPRLVVVVDEFATLAAELPDFLGSLVGVAQRGRSLGVHLVLATQRPSGAINDDIRTNTNLRIALRVLDPSDSTDVIGGADAAAIGRSQAGRALVRLGPGEVVAFQTALVSATSDRAADRPAIRLEPAGVAATEPDGAGGDGTDLHALVAAIRMAFERSGLAEPRRPWPEPLPERITATEAGPHAFAVADDPGRQRRVPISWRLDDGNLLVYGLPGSGVSTALAGAVLSVLGSTGADDVHVYAIDHGAGGLARLVALPHTGAVVDGGDREGQARLLRMLRATVAERRSGGVAEPRIVLAVDNVGGLLAAFDDVAGLETIDDLTRVFLDGPAAGVHVAIGADRVGGVPTALASVTTQKLLLRLGDVYDYATFGLRPVAVPTVAGRGWWAEDGLEVQVAVPDPSAVPAEPASWRPPRPVRSLPVEVTVDEVAPSVDIGAERWVLPVGLGDRDIEPVGFALYDGEHALVCGPSRSGKSTALMALADAVGAAAPGVAVHAVASARSPLRAHPGVDLVDAADVGALATGERPWLLLVDDADLVDDPTGALRALLEAGAPGGRVVATARPDRLRAAYGHWTTIVRESRIGLALKPDPDLDGDLWRTTLPRRFTSRPAPGRGWLVSDGEVELVQVAQPRAAGVIEESAA